MSDYVVRPSDVRAENITLSAPINTDAKTGAPRLARVLKGSRSEIGQLSGPRENVYGLIQDIAVDDAGRIYVLDSRFSEVRVIALDGTLLQIVGGPGRGPGEFVNPLSIAVAPGGELYVGDLNRRVHVFKLSSDSLVYETDLQLKVSPHDLCIMNGGLFVHGLNPEAMELIHTYDLNGRWESSFGSVYHSPNPMVNLEVSRGLIACAPREGVVVFAPRGVVGELRGYTADGMSLWRATLEGYQSIAVRDMPGGYEVEIPESGFHRVEMLSPAPDGRVTLQVASVVRRETQGGAEAEVESIQTFAVDVRTGSGVKLSEGAPLIGWWTDAFAVTFAQDPFPKLEIHRAPRGVTNG